MSQKVCRFPKCGRPVYRKEKVLGLCAGHSSQHRRSQPLRPLFERTRPAGTKPRIRCDEVACPNPDLIGPCHVFRGSKNCGYGWVGVKGSKSILVHRYIWEAENGPIPEDMMIDHMCRNRACCNVDHLRVVTSRINAIENSLSTSAKNAAKTHCLRGHELTEANTCRTKRKGRRCRLCNRLHAKRKSV